MPSKENNNATATETVVENKTSFKTLKEYEAELNKEKIKNHELQKSYELKCQEYNKLLEAYRSMAVRFSNAGAAAKTFIEAAYNGIDLLFPKEN